jgi:molecular chaperone GrpE (heat shock protein)
MPNNTSTLEKQTFTADPSLVARLNKALYSTEQQQRFLHLQAEVENLLEQLQSQHSSVSH